MLGQPLSLGFGGAAAGVARRPSSGGSGPGRPQSRKRGAPHGGHATASAPLIGLPAHGTDNAVMATRKRMQRERKERLAEMRPRVSNFAHDATGDLAASAAQLCPPEEAPLLSLHPARRCGGGGGASATAKSARGRSESPASRAPQEQPPDEPPRQRRAVVLKVERFHRGMIRREVMQQKLDFLYKQIAAEVAAEVQQEPRRPASAPLGGSQPAAASGVQGASAVSRAPGAEAAPAPEVAAAAAAGPQATAAASSPCVAAPGNLRRQRSAPAIRGPQHLAASQDRAGGAPALPAQYRAGGAGADGPVAEAAEASPQHQRALWVKTGPKRCRSGTPCRSCASTAAASRPSSGTKSSASAPGGSRPGSGPSSRASSRPGSALRPGPARASGATPRRKTPAELLTPAAPAASAPSLGGGRAGGPKDLLRTEYYEGDERLMLEDILHASNPHLFPLRQGPCKPFPLPNLVAC